MKKAVAALDWSLYIKCPYCNGRFDLSESDSDYDGMLSKAIFNNTWGDLIGE
jgi:hypothetical protein